MGLGQRVGGGTIRIGAGLIQSATVNRIWMWLAVLAFGALAGSAYTTIAYETIPPDILETWPGLRGGITIAGLSAGFEIFVMRGPVGE